MIEEIQRLGPSLHRQVRRAGGRLQPEEAAQLLLGANGPVGQAGRQVILALAGKDPRLDVDANGWIVLAPDLPHTLALAKTEFVVVDIETTSTRPGTARITEVGAVRVRGGTTLETFTQLVNPGLPVSGSVARLTGIHDGMLADAPPFRRIAVPWLDFLGNAVLVAHNAPFDTRFLDQELRRCGEETPRNTVLCTVRLARRLVPGLRSHNLDSLADFFHLEFSARHRALGDAEVTARLLIRLLELASRRGYRTLGGLRKLVAGAIPRGQEDDLLARA